MNHGTQSCLAVLEADRVQTILCGGTIYTSWNCSDSLLSPLGSSQGYLVANRKEVAIGNVRSLKAQWQDAADRSVCEGKAAKTEYDRYFFAALASTHVYDHTAGNATLVLGIDQGELEQLLWFFRTEDPSTWNYSILALSFVAMILGLLLLAINVMRNRKRKIHSQSPQQAELDAKQALMPVQEYSPAKPQKPEPSDQKSGDVMVQWKDGTVTSLYTETSEDAI
ncbi:organic solute transporter subunit beta [Patagioenas fasciata monilis]|uniref:Organic solute transporter subunit beta n=1 Tax=Patagioenas fasciata monilis TaxID=372326 RepID=A0A1V4JDU0_PATFA|nr:organic solute transporter subunit beta [Patagioenas fasciata monilis]